MNPGYEATGITRVYGSTRALDDVDFAVRPGEVHALLGMNGAGKSTLVKVLVGVESPDAGTLALDGAPLTLPSLRVAFDHGVAVVAQDLNVFDDLDVLANLFLLREPRRLGLVDTAAMTRQARAALERVGLGLDPRTRVGQLSQSDKQRVAIARAVLFEPKVLLLDEPTSALQPREKQLILDVVRRLRQGGTAIVYVSHFLEEVYSVADRITVLRDGRVAVPGTPITTITLGETVRAMTGGVEALPGQAPAPAIEQDQVADADGPRGAPLRVEQLSRRGAFEDVSLEARPGEILGVAGLEGSGARELLAAVFGAAPADSGRAVMPDGRLVGHRISASVRAGLAYVPADRQRSGVMTEASIMDNLLQVRVATLGRAGFVLRRASLVRRARRRVDQLGIKIGHLNDKLSSLSGGNQQKVLLGKWLEAEARVYLLDDPTAAVDVHARAEVHEIIRSVAAAGEVVVVTSSDPEELLQLCHRIVVLHNGRVAVTLPAAGLSTHDLLEAVQTGKTSLAGAA